jgi:hypothetical protein
MFSFCRHGSGHQGHLSVMHLAYCFPEEWLLAACGAFGSVKVQDRNRFQV